jgi:hypothetical protein
MDGTQKLTATEEQRRFVQHLEQATEIVRKWPAWKRAVLGGPLLGQQTGELNSVDIGDQQSVHRTEESQRRSAS